MSPPNPSGRQISGGQQCCFCSLISHCRQHPCNTSNFLAELSHHPWPLLHTSQLPLNCFLILFTFTTLLGNSVLGSSSYFPSSSAISRSVCWLPFHTPHCFWYDPSRRIWACPQWGSQNVTQTPSYSCMTCYEISRVALQACNESFFFPSPFPHCLLNNFQNLSSLCCPTPPAFALWSLLPTALISNSHSSLHLTLNHP